MRDNITDPLTTADFLKGGHSRRLNLSGLQDVQNMADMISKAKQPKKSNNIEKGAISDVLDGFGSAFRDKNLFEKTGAEIKAKIEGLVTVIKAKKTALIEKLEALEEEIGFAPNQDPDEYELREFPGDTDIITLLKRYDYNMCYYNNGSNNNVDVSTSSEKVEKPQCAESMEQARLCSSYNTGVYQIKDCVKDLKNAHVFITNLDEKKNYQLSLTDLKNLGF